MVICITTTKVQNLKICLPYWYALSAGAQKTAFTPVNAAPVQDSPAVLPLETDDALREMSFGELSAMCSNMALGCEKQQLSSLIAEKLAKLSDDPVKKQFAEAIARSNRKMAENIYREAGYMLPQSRNSHVFLKSLLKTDTDPDFPREAVEELFELLPINN